MNIHKKIGMAILASVGLAIFIACSPKEVKLQTPVQDNNTGKWAYADSTGKVAISYIYEEANAFKDGLAKVKLNGKQGFIDHTGKEIIPLTYEEVGDFSDDGMAKAKLNGKQGFIDKTGKEVIPLKYDEIGAFAGDAIKVGVNGKYGYIDNSGKEIIPLTYDSADDFANGRAKVKQNSTYHLINAKGEILPDEMYLQFTYRQTGQNAGGIPVAKIDNFTFNDMASGEQLSYKKLVINGQTVVSTRCYTESGMNGMNVAEFSFGGGRYIGYSVALGQTKTLKYKLENGTLTVLEK